MSAQIQRYDYVIGYGAFGAYLCREPDAEGAVVTFTDHEAARTADQQTIADLASRLETFERGFRALWAVVGDLAPPNSDLRTENESLKRRLAAITNAAPSTAEQTIAELRREVKGLRRDAERYRWLRTQQSFAILDFTFGEDWATDSDNDLRRGRMDTLIDAAVAQPAVGGEGG